MHDLAITALKTVLDPDIGVNIVDLGLIESLEVDVTGVTLRLIMTSPACPQADYLADQAAEILQSAFADLPVSVDVAPSPLWDPARMSPAARQQLGWA